MKQCISDAIKPSGEASLEDDVAAWTEEVDVLQKLRPTQALLDEIRNTEIPLLQQQIKQLDDDMPDIISAAEEVYTSSSFRFALSSLTLPISGQ